MWAKRGRFEGLVLDWPGMSHPLSSLDLERKTSTGFSQLSYSAKPPTQIQISSLGRGERPKAQRSEKRQEEAGLSGGKSGPPRAGGHPWPHLVSYEMSIVPNGALPERTRYVTAGGLQSPPSDLLSGPPRQPLLPQICIHAFSKLFLSTYCVPGSVAETGLAPALLGSHSSGQGWDRGARGRGG